MDWPAIWEWLSDPDNQATLGFLGGGLAAVAAGIWAVLKYLRSRRGKEPPSLTVKADHGSVAAGRDAIVKGRDAEPKQE